MAAEQPSPPAELPVMEGDAVDVFSKRALEWFRGHVVNAGPKKVRVQWTTGGCEYVKELGRQSEHIRLPNGESFKEASSFQGSYEGWEFSTHEGKTGYYRKGTRRRIAPLEFPVVQRRTPPRVSAYRTSPGEPMTWAERTQGPPTTWESYHRAQAAQEQAWRTW